MLGTWRYADQNVYPLAANFEDFIRLILACGTANPVEQIVWIDKSIYNIELYSCTYCQNSNLIIHQYTNYHGTEFQNTCSNPDCDLMILNGSIIFAQVLFLPLFQDSVSIASALNYSNAHEHRGWKRYGRFRPYSSFLMVHFQQVPLHADSFR